MSTDPLHRNPAPKPLLKDGSYQDKRSRGTFLKKVRAGYSPEVAADKAGIPISLIFQNIERGDSELKQVVEGYEVISRALRDPSGLHVGRAKVPTPDEIRKLTLGVLAPRTIEHASERLDNLDTNPHTNPEGYKADLEMFNLATRMLTALMPKEVISDTTVRMGESEASKMSRDQREERLRQLREEKALLLEERRRAEKTEARVVDFELEKKDAESSGGISTAGGDGGGSVPGGEGSLPGVPVEVPPEGED